MELYLIYAESMHYAGYGQHFVVQAEDASEAEDLASSDMDEFFYEQDSDQLEEDEVEEGPYFTAISVEKFDETHAAWKFYQDPSQAEFYIKVNF